MTTQEEHNRLRKIIDDRAEEWINDPNTNTTQEEVITWHKYPDEKPKNWAYCLVTARYNNRCAWVAVIYKIGRWILQNNNNDDMELHKSWTVIAWAEPKGWQE